MRTFIIILIVTAGLRAVAADLPGRLLFGFNAGGARAANDHERWGASGTGYGYFGEVAYESTSWFVGPVVQWGYVYASGAVPPEEIGGYPGYPTGVKTDTNTFFLGARGRIPLWRMKLRPYGGGGLVWTNYRRQIMDGAAVLLKNESVGSGWAALGGVEFFPDPARGFSLALEYRYGVTGQEWRRIPPGVAKSDFDVGFDLTESLITFGVKMYAL